MKLMRMEGAMVLEKVLRYTTCPLSSTENRVGMGRPTKRNSLS